MATNYTLLAILCLAAFGSNQQLDGHSVVQRQHIVNIAKAEIGVREATGNNDGKRVEEYLAITGLQKGKPWCAAFVSWVFASAGYKEPRTAWSPSLFGKRVNTKKVQPGNVLGIWFPGLKRIAHAGLVEQQQGNWILSIEGNTTVAGSREGDGVYRKRRHIRTVYAFANWIQKQQEVR